MEKDYFKLSQEIYRRKSVREYTDDTIDFLEDGTDLTKKFGLVPLFKDIRFEIAVLKDGEIKNRRSKYCIAFYSEDIDGCNENVGFIGQQLSLELQAMGIGTCWRGVKKPNSDNRSRDGLRFVLSMTAGYPKGPATRSVYDFNRVDAADIAIGEPDEYIEAVRLAPSAVNNQPWAVEKSGAAYNFYLKKARNFFLGMVLGENLRKIDMGIGMAHLFIKVKAAGKDAVMSANGQNLPDALYIGTIEVK
ncbi:MAG: hypothetical protein LBQ40_06545 [Clostridiales bacterium]|jgi:hypothetical protein|nr:hypothetical protein [Clostridiales bacterium]